MQRTARSTTAPGGALMRRSARNIASPPDEVTLVSPRSCTAQPSNAAHGTGSCRLAVQRVRLSAIACTPPTVITASSTKDEGAALTTYGSLVFVPTGQRATGVTIASSSDGAISSKLAEGLLRYWHLNWSSTRAPGMPTTLCVWLMVSAENVTVPPCATAVEPATASCGIVSTCALVSSEPFCDNTPLTAAVHTVELSLVHNAPSRSVSTTTNVGCGVIVCLTSPLELSVHRV